MFQFRRFPTCTYLIQCRLTEYCSAGFPHSEICGSKLMCSSPQLIAACHVLHRLLMPRHSPCALISLTSSAWTSHPSLPPAAKAHSLRHASSPNRDRFAGSRFGGTLERSPSSIPRVLVRTGISKLVLKNYAGTNRCHCSFALPFMIKSPQKNFVTSLLLACTFMLSVQFSRCRVLAFYKVRSKHPETPDASMRSCSGPKWTRTTDLTIISRAL